MILEGEWSYWASESTFVKYFDRLKKIGHSYGKIEGNLHMSNKYYKEIVLDTEEYDAFYGEPTLHKLFLKWKSNQIN